MNSLVRSLRRLATKETGIDPDEHMLTSRCRSLCRMSLVDSNDNSFEDNDTTPGLRKSLRKEVIQPQVPLRLPCYDLVPVTSLAVGTVEIRRLRALPASMT